MNLDLLNDDVAALLRSGDHRYTTGRRRVVSALHGSDGPVTILDILQLEASLAQSSVYRNLAILEEVGAVTRIVTHDDHARFELTEALTDHHHHHLNFHLYQSHLHFSVLHLVQLTRLPYN